MAGLLCYNLAIIENQKIAAGCWVEECVMKAEQRIKTIYSMILKENTIRVGELANRLEISQPTVRKDLLQMEADGLIIRKFGKAILKNRNSHAPSYSYNESSSSRLVTTPEKTAIGNYAASLVEDGQTILLDCGATTTEMAKSLLIKSRLRIVTTGVNIAMILGQKPDNHVILSGGVFLAETLSMSGENAVNFFRSIHVERLFLAANGICPGTGLTYTDFIDIGVKRAMIDAASEVYLLLSSDKIGHKDFAAIDVCSRIHTIITDSFISSKNRDYLETLPCKIIEVPVERQNPLCDSIDET